MLVAIEDDLMFLSRIREAARATGAEVKVARTGAALVAACEAGATRVLVNLDSSRLPVFDAVRELRALPRFASVTVTGYVSHVNADRARQAQAEGFDRVLARSAFVQELPELVGGGA